MAVRDDFAPGEVLASADLNDTFASKLDLAGGKILQIVRATDSTQRDTTSQTYVDATGMSVTITPQKSDSALILIATFSAQAFRAGGGTDTRVTYQITDSSNNAISGVEETPLLEASSSNMIHHQTLLAYATPATTSAVTYKLRHRVGNADSTSRLQNNTCTGQMYAIEVSA